MKQFTAVVAIMDDVLDSQGECLSENVSFDHDLIVYREFNFANALGAAEVRKVGNQLVAHLDLFDDSLPPNPEDLYCAVGGFKNKKGTPNSWTVDSLNLTYYPADKRLPKIKKVYRNSQE